MRRIENNLVKENSASFIWAAIGWLFFGVGVIWGLTTNGGILVRTLGWFCFLWFICVFNFFATAQTFKEVFQWVLGLQENCSITQLRTFYWGTIKLVCLGMLIGIIWTQEQEIPQKALFLGLGTWVIVPLVGVLGWFRKDQKEK